MRLNGERFSPPNAAAPAAGDEPPAEEERARSLLVVAVDSRGRLERGIEDPMSRNQRTVRTFKGL
jgi:hypothetical protein